MYAIEKRLGTAAIDDIVPAAYSSESKSVSLAMLLEFCTIITNRNEHSSTFARRYIQRAVCAKFTQLYERNLPVRSSKRFISVRNTTNSRIIKEGLNKQRFPKHTS